MEMLGTIRREEVNLNDQNYTPNTERYKFNGNEGVPSFDARLQRNQDMYNLYASSSSVMTEQPRRQKPMNVDMSRQEALWQKLNQNTASLVNNNRSTFSPSQEYQEHPAFYDTRRQELSMTFEPMSLTNKPTPNALKAREKVAKKSKKKQISTQGKVILAVYFAVIILIAALIIVNTEMGKINNVEAPSQSVTNLYNVNESGLAFIEAPYNSTASTNWFDEFCDKLSN